MKIYDNISKIVGNTPLVRINNLAGSGDASILAKLEFFNPTSSVKDRIGVSMIDAAEKDGFLKPGGTIIEATSGNTGLGLAMVAASRGYHLIITMPESMSIERRFVLEHLGAEIILTPAEEGMTGAVERAEALLDEVPNAFIPRQFNNPANPYIHETTTGVEIWNDTDGQVDIFVSGVGTGGTITGVARYLKSQKQEVQIVAVEPDTSAVLSGDPSGKHAIQGIGAGFIPAILDTEVIDQIVRVSDDDAFKTARQLAKNEGILCGISSGAIVYVASQLALKPENKGKTIVAVICDTGDRYLSTNLFA